MINSPPWRNAGVNGNEDDKESSVSGGDWSGRTYMKRNDSSTTDESLMGQWETESKQSSYSSSILLSPSYLLDSDELDLATSECSELSDMSWQSHVLPKTTSISNGLVTRAKKSSRPRQVKNKETRYIYNIFIGAS